MAKVKSSSGGFVDVQITGIIDTIRKLQDFYKLLPDKTNIALVQAADSVKNEVKESIIGNRDEPKSVDTGNFANSVEIKPESDNSLIVYSDLEYAKFLEWGTSRMDARKHFSNTASRVEEDIKEMFIIQMKEAKKETF